MGCQDDRVSGEEKVGFRRRKWRMKTGTVILCTLLESPRAEDMVDEQDFSEGTYIALGYQDGGISEEGGE